jgi:hypothetical protein
MQEIAALLNTQSVATNQVTVKLEGVLTRIFNGLGSYNQADIEPFLERIVPIVTAAQIQVASITESYLISVAAQLGLTLPPVNIADKVEVRKPEETYKRPFRELWGGLKDGKSFNDSFTAAQSRVKRLASDDIAISQRSATVAVLSSSERVTGYRRVIRPEMSKSGTCGLCIAASDQRYGKERLMPIHSKCSCTVMPIIKSRTGKEQDPGREINGQDISDLYKQASKDSKESGKDLSSTRFKVAESADLGPELLAA